MNIFSKIKILAYSPLSFNRIVFILLVRIILKSLYLISSFVDFIFFRKYKKQKINKPVFLIGYPRSGTTFLHRFLLEIYPRYRGMYLWEMILPYVSLRIILKPFIKFLDKRNKIQLYDSRIHSTGLFKAETDDVSLFFKSFEGLFLWLYFGAFKQYENKEKLKEDLIKITDIEKTIFNLKKIHAKNLSFEGDDKVMISKSFSLILNIEYIFSLFPSAKIILLMRDPMETIPSSMSLATGILKNLYDFDKLNNQLKINYYNNLYEAAIVFYKSLHKVIQDIDKFKDNLIVVDYKKLKTDFLSEFFRLIKFLEINFDDIDKNKLLQQAEKQKKYKSRHEYSLKTFGISDQRIKNDFDFIYKYYDF